MQSYWPRGERAILHSECTIARPRSIVGKEHGERAIECTVLDAARCTAGASLSLAPIRLCLGSPALGCCPTACGGIPGRAASRNEPYLDVAAGRVRVLPESRDGRGVPCPRPLPGSIHWALSRLTSRARKGTVKGQTGPHRPRGFVHDTPTGASCSEHEGKIGSRVEEADGAGGHASEAVCWTRRGASREGRMWGCYR